MSKRGRRILVAVIALSALAAIFFGLRSYSSFLLLRSAYEVGKPQLSSLRAWMTLDHVAATYRVPEDELIARLKLPPDTSRNESLKAIADKRGVSRFGQGVSESAMSAKRGWAWFGKTRVSRSWPCCWGIS